MLGWLDQAETGGGDGAHRLMREIAATLGTEGVPVRGAIQTNQPAANCHCDMSLEILGDGGPEVVISQDLGPSATGCRLDAGALELAAQRVLNTLPEARLVVLNKYGKQEIMGRGMVAVIADAMDRDLPVLISVAPEQQAEFLSFAGDLAVKLAPGDAARWCRDALQAPAA
ncbi:MAG TPA: DUF2478 domain-containing protein [Paracoccus sp. (in: a-proteobacteria)]|uniref:DUF2478 domain-containing protein n=1 Tax=uncultured Paracoccus sp. TaxID=189685 RepID=UPI0026338481|nr:DUF2478 domain-containing protein [uncultured Paracoccus sp.]HMQ40445.1 DUF2478 domain-containing protein [Paracoccus sp. (in: a-proteobacteria)]HMR34938.1 DUF2478 domain-containing protein [Paracoccus sp. (in: a-proteobacteria)]